MPSPRCPNRKSSPATTTRTPSPATRKDSTNSTGGIALRRVSKRSSATRSSGCPRSALSFSRSRVRRGGAFSPGEELQRLRLERDEGGRYGVLAAERRELPDQRLVAEVHAVEVADGGDAAVMLAQKIVPAADQFQPGSPRRVPTRCNRGRVAGIPGRRPAWR